VIAYIGLGQTQKGDYLNSEDLELLEAMSDYVGIALENARLYKSLEQRAAEYHDLKDFNENIIESINVGVLAHDMRYFAIAYAIAIGSAFLPVDPPWIRWIVAVVLLAIYAIYVKGHLQAEGTLDEEELGPLRFRKLDRASRVAEPVAPRLRVINLQVLFALGLIILGAVFFVDAVEHLASSLGVSEVLLALVIAPVATELPEKFNSILWVRQNKDTLAMGNITGAMVFQSTIPTVVGLVLASEAWSIREGSYTAFASAGIAFIASAAIFIPMVRRGGLSGRHLLVKMVGDRFVVELHLDQGARLRQQSDVHHEQ
jgi:cation:H+ antiporter